MTSNLEAAAKQFYAGLETSGKVLDPEGVHHVLSAGGHGQKVNFDALDDKEPLYKDWVNLTKLYIEEEFPRLPEIVIGVANGANRLALDVSLSYKGEIVGMKSIKDESDPERALSLSHHAAKFIAYKKPELVLVLEDVGNTGKNSAQVVRAALQAGAQNAEVLNTLQRSPDLEKLDEAEIAYRSIIYKELKTYTPEECQSTGFCAKDWELIER